MTHIVLLGDSVIDNKAYVGQGPDVAEQLRTLAPKEWEVTRLAVDGAVSLSVLQQLDRVPGAATHLVISAGGNDALRESAVLDATARSVGEALLALATIQDRFRASSAGADSRPRSAPSTTHAFQIRIVGARARSRSQ